MPVPPNSCPPTGCPALPRPPAGASCKDMRLEHAFLVRQPGGKPLLKLRQFDYTGLLQDLQDQYPHSRAGDYLAPGARGGVGRAEVCACTCTCGRGWGERWGGGWRGATSSPWRPALPSSICCMLHAVQAHPSSAPRLYPSPGRSAWRGRESRLPIPLTTCTLAHEPTQQSSQALLSTVRCNRVAPTKPLAEAIICPEGQAGKAADAWAAGAMLYALLFVRHPFERPEDRSTTFSRRVHATVKRILEASGLALKGPPNPSIRGMAWHGMAWHGMAAQGSRKLSVRLGRCGAGALGTPHPPPPTHPPTTPTHTHTHTPTPAHPPPH
jgi:hypothetical protein